MSESNQHTRQNKPWYKKWWGVILAIIIWPFFLTWFTWSKTKWRKLAKIGATLAIGIASLVSLSVMAAGQPQPVDTPKTVASTQSSSTDSKPTKQTTTQPAKTNSSSTLNTTKPAPTSQPTVSLATLEAQGKVTLTTATKRFEDYYAKVQSDAAQSDAANSSSAFNNDKWNTDITPETLGQKDYNTVSNAYFNAHVQQPASLDVWSTDSQQVFTDTTHWVQDEWQVLADQTTGAPSDTDQAKVTTDEQAYTTDLAQVKTDISQL